MARKAIIEKAKLMIMSHNHPCGSLRPSEEDLAVTKKLAEACKTIEIRLYDHIIVTSKSYLSFKEEGML
ncbi:JAB domain-containing protein [Wolbachia endosymbiont of Tribolium confusum]|uniref:JAB domain-containing protein n=1 Tax=Wolbachia endosymbiont of Tribolium confusum TaxID=214474 RepID=UPI001CF341E9|nr:DNA repair protein RadC [Wolbachia endosymbiont of Tribolium confusum]